MGAGLTPGQVYTILFLQILGTTLVASVMRANNMALWVQEKCVPVGPSVGMVAN